MKDFLRGGRSNSIADATPVSSVLPSFTSPRTSVLPSVRLPLGSLRRRHNANEPPSHTKSPLLTLNLSSRSFLDSTIGDGTLRGPLYEIKTVGTSTTVLLNNHKRISVETATIIWPRVLPAKTAGKESTDGVQINLRGTRYLGGETLLKPGANSNCPRKFNIPNYSQPMKWKGYGNTYWCTTPSVKGPIAILETSKGTEPITLSFFETLHDKYDPNAVAAHHGVSVLLLDYVLITAMLLVTDLQEWMVVRKYEGNGLHLSGQALTSTPDLPSTSDPKFRKIMFGEPIYPKLAAGTESRWLSDRSQSLSPTTSSFPRRPSAGGASTAYPESDSSSSPPASPKMTMSTTLEFEENEEVDDSSFLERAQPSVFAESFQFSEAASSTSTYPSSYGNSPNNPPVPQIPPRFNSLNDRAFRSQPSTPIAASFRPVRDYPPPLPESPLSDSFGSRVERSQSVQSYTSNFSQAVPSSLRRPLPRPPTVPPISSSPPLARRVQSSNHLRTDASFSVLSPPSLPQRSLPPTPGIGDINMQAPALAPVPGPENDDALVRVPHHSRRPPITKASQEDLTNWVHTLTNPQRDLPPAPLPSSSIYDVPPPAYDTINFSPQPSQNRLYSSLPEVLHPTASDPL